VLGCHPEGRRFAFYLPHMEYEGSIDFAMGNIMFAYFHVLRLFMAKNMI
jgi:hypothetical protein